MFGKQTGSKTSYCPAYILSAIRFKHKIALGIQSHGAIIEIG